MGSGSFRQEEDKTAFESLQAAADQSLINSPVDDVTSWAPAMTKGMCVCVCMKACTGTHAPKKSVSQGCVWIHAPGLCVHLRIYMLFLCSVNNESQIQLSLLLKAREVSPKT